MVDDHVGVEPSAVVMTMRMSRQKVWLLIAILVSFVPGQVSAGKGAVGVLLSKEIAPYVSMVEGLESRLADLSVERFFLDSSGRAYSLGKHGATLDPDYFDILVAVGPEAMRHLLAATEPAALVYGMILDPETLTDASSAPCGVMLNLPFDAQLSVISRHFPEMKKLGVFYDPVNNQAWFDAAQVIADAQDVQLVPLQVRKADTGLRIVGEMGDVDAILFIPDPSIISKVVIRHIIKEAIHRRIPAVGFNRYFHDSGAALSFLIDYRAVGVQVATLVRQRLSGEACPGSEPPMFHALVNEDTWRVLGLQGQSTDLVEGAGD